MDEPDRVIAHFVYRSLPTTRRHGVSIMLVTRLQGSNVLARVKPLGRGDSGSRRSTLEVLGPWSTTASQRYAKARVVATSGSLNGAISS